MTTIVFSKNRAMQLQAFLRSYQKHVTPLDAVQVIYLATSREHSVAYMEVSLQFAFVFFVPQCASFKETLLLLLPLEGNVVFFVDDMVFLRDWLVAEEPGLSLRLGLHLQRNYASNGEAQPLPPYAELPDGRVTWRWRDGATAWRYPLSVDGHVFALSQVRPLIAAAAFTSPNTLESELQQHLNLFLDQRGTCYREAKVVNIPWNLVQSDWYNRHGDASAEAMLGAWESGLQICLDGIDGTINESVHQEFPLVLEDRP